MNLSYWETEYLIHKIDYLIIGMGITGLQTAINLKEKNKKASVIVIDRFPWSHGASTRNAGFACFANVSEILDDLKHDSSENVYSLISKRYTGLKKLRSKFGDDNLGYEEKGSEEIFSTTNREEMTNAIDSIQGINTILYDEIGLDHVFQFASRSTFPNTLGTIRNKFEGQLNTGKMYQSISRYAQLLGVKFFGGIEVESWEKVNNTVNVATNRNITLKAQNLVLCTNAFTSQILEEDIVPARGQVIVTEKLETLPCEGLHLFNKGYYYWRDIDNRILLGGARNMDKAEETSFKLEPNYIIIDELKRFMNEEIFGNEVSIDFEWSGIMGLGKENQKTPIVKMVEPNVYLAARLGGMGVALSALVAEEITALVD
ncbi:MAG: FAD-binding oxidoreductase [Bacteroidia bacterium]|nr:FAD-binding oxidoreductase [Bacteroidia bacterium]